MRFLSWNVNGLRAVRGKGFEDIFLSLDADFFCLQETKLQAGQIDLAFPGYESYWCYAEKKGYSGTAIFTKHTPLSVSYKLKAHRLPDALGGRFSRLPLRIGSEEAGHRLRRHERRA